MFASSLLNSLNDNYFIMLPNFDESKLISTPSFKSYINHPNVAEEYKGNKLIGNQPSKSNFYCDKVSSSGNELMQTIHPLHQEKLDGYGFPLSLYQATVIDDQREEFHAPRIQVGYWCPYLSLPYLDLLNPKKLCEFFELMPTIHSNNGNLHSEHANDSQTNSEYSISCFVFGASNVLFKQKALQLDVDVVIDLDTGKIDFPFDNMLNNYPPDKLADDRIRRACLKTRKLKRSLMLSNADISFVNYITRRIKLLRNIAIATPTSEQPNSTFNLKLDDIDESHLPGQNKDIIDPEKQRAPDLALSPVGIKEDNPVEPLKDFNNQNSHDILDLDSWIRSQFHLYLVSLLSTTKMSDSLNRPKYEEDFNSDFVREFKATLAYRIWNNETHELISEVQAGHPFQGSSFSEKISNVLFPKNQTTARLFNEATQQATKKIGSVWNNTKSSFSSIFQP